MSDENAVPQEPAVEETVAVADDQTAEEQTKEAVERAADSDAGKAPEGGALAIKDVRYLGTGVKVTDPDDDGFQAITFLIDSRQQHTYIFGPQTAAYLHEKTLSPEARALIAGVEVEIPEDPTDA